jgi:hypothetical protein
MTLTCYLNSQSEQSGPHVYSPPPVPETLSYTPLSDLVKGRGVAQQSGPRVLDLREVVCEVWGEEV